MTIVRAAARIDKRTTWHAGYKVSQLKRKRIEEVFGWLKTVGMLAFAQRPDTEVCTRSAGCSPSRPPLTTWSECGTHLVSGVFCCPSNLRIHFCAYEQRRAG
jgi:hypothetical protein